MAQTFKELYELAQRQRVDLVAQVYNYRVEHPMSVAKVFLDSADPTPRDLQVLQDAQQLAQLHKSITDVIARNIVIGSDRGKVSPSGKAELVRAKTQFLTELAMQLKETVATLSMGQIASRAGFAYPALRVNKDGRSFDLLDKEYPSGVRCNFTIQQHPGGNFIYAYTNEAMIQRLQNTVTNPVGKRIYMNPDFVGTPKIFEETLRKLNDAGIPAEIKMLHRAQELQDTRVDFNSGRNVNFRGDGIVLYVDDKYADLALNVVLDVVQENAEFFQDRQISKVPLQIAPGVGVADEFGIKGHSTTSAVAEVLDADVTKGLEAFRAEVGDRAKEVGIDSEQLYKRIEPAAQTQVLATPNPVGQSINIGVDPKVSGFLQR